MDSLTFNKNSVLAIATRECQSEDATNSVKCIAAYILSLI